MAMTVIWTGMVVTAVLCGMGTGQGTQVALAALEGAQAAVELSISMMGVLCLWSGAMEVMRRSGLANKVSRLLQPVLRRLFWQNAGDQQVMENIAANVSANLLGLGNAATPLGIQAIQGMHKDNTGRASDAVCMLVVCNTASIQLIPTTVAALRMSQGCETPFDILPAVWIASGISVSVGIVLCKLFSKIWKG